MYGIELVVNAVVRTDADQGTHNLGILFSIDVECCLACHPSAPPKAEIYAFRPWGNMYKIHQDVALEPFVHLSLWSFVSWVICFLGPLFPWSSCVNCFPPSCGMVHASLRLAVATLAAVASAVPAALLVERAGPVLPSKDSFYAVPDNVDQAKPGAILRQRKTPYPVATFGLAPVRLDASHQILYRTTDSFGNATATVLTVLVPDKADYNKVLSYQVAEDAASLDCAPSYAVQLLSATGPLLGTLVTQAELLLIEASLEQGWVVIIPDFQGPNAAYLANALAGHATLDGIRAALNSASTTGISEKPTIAMWGYSGGSVATNWAVELQPQYAPELEIAGAAVGGTVPDITSVVKSVNKSFLAGLIPTGILGLTFEYPHLKSVVAEHVKPAYSAKLYKTQTQCFVANVAEFAFQDVVGMFDDPQLIYRDPIITRILRDNAFGRKTPTIPLYWYKSANDQVSPIADSDAVVDTYCANGASVEYVRDFASDHGSEALLGAPEALRWLKGVMDGNRPGAGCSKKSVFSSWADIATLKILSKVLNDAFLDLLGKNVEPILFG